MVFWPLALAVPAQSATKNIAIFKIQPLLSPQIAARERKATSRVGPRVGRGWVRSARSDCAEGLKETHVLWRTVTRKNCLANTLDTSLAPCRYGLVQR